MDDVLLCAPRRRRTLVGRALHLWGARDSAENTTGAGWQAARDVCERFLAWAAKCGRPVRQLSEQAIYEWLDGETAQPGWRTNRLNVSLPQRVVIALLEVLGHPRVGNILVSQRRQSLHCDLPDWLSDLGLHLPLHPAQELADLLWAAFQHEWTRIGPPAHKRKMWLEKRRRWCRHLSQRGLHSPEGAPLALPAAYSDPAYAALDPRLRLQASLQWSDAATVLDWFSRLHQAVQQTAPRTARVLVTYERPLLHLFGCLVPGAERPTPRSPLLPTLHGATRMQVVAALNASRRDRGRCIKAVFQLTSGVWTGLLPGWTQWAPITRQEVGHQPVPRRRHRDRFTAAEVSALRDATAPAPLDHGLFTFFLHTTAAGFF